MPDIAFVGLSVLLGIPVGLVVARASVALPNPEITGHVGPYRKLALVLICTGLALWAGMVWPGPKAFLGALLAWQLLMLALLDAEHFWLPRSLTIALIASGIVAAAAMSLQQLSEHLLGAAVGFFLLAALAFLYRRFRGRDGLGGGDAWLLAGGGAWTGWQGLPTILVLGSGAGLIFVALMALRGNPIGRAQPMPFGVGLAIGIWFTWLYGPLDGYSYFS